MLRPLTTKLALKGVALLIAAAGTTGSGQSQQHDRWYAWLKRHVLDRIEISGYRTLGYHSFEVSGDSEAFSELNLYGQGNRRFTDIGQLRVTGRRVFGLLDFESQIQDSRFSDPQAQSYTFRFERKGLRLEYGDVDARISANRFAGFAKSLRGVTVSYRTRGLSASLVRSESRGSARTVAIQGTNSAGPYYLQSSQIVRGSEDVRVDGVQMQIQRDYVIDYELGSLTFVSRIVPTTSTIVVSYEAFGFNATPGIIQGAVVAYDFGRAGRVSIAALQQIARGQTDLNARLEKFQGFGSPSTPYILQFEPLPGSPIQIRLDGVIQTEGIDYYFDPGNASIFYFRRFVPATSTIDVLYTPRPRETIDGDRDVFGLQYSLPLGKGGRNGEIALGHAFGKLKSTVNPLSGTAREARLRYRTGQIELRASAVDVPSGFVGIESRGFNRNERSIEVGLRAEGKSGFSYELAHANQAVTIRQTDNQGNLLFQNSRFTNAWGALRYQAPTGARSFSLEQRQTHVGQSGKRTQVQSTTARWSERFPQGDLSLSLERRDARGPLIGSPTGEIARVLSNMARLGAHYQADPFSLSAEFGVSQIQTGGQSGAGKDYSLNLAYNPSSRLSVNVGYLVSESGALALASQIASGYGLGYDGNGFSGGPISNTPNGATDVRVLQLNADYLVTDWLSLGLRASRQRYFGSISSNTETTSLGFDITATLPRGHTIALSADRSESEFLDLAGRSTGTYVDFSYRASPPGRLSYSVGINAFQSSGGQFAQDSVSWELGATWRLAERHSIGASLASTATRGYLPQNDLSWVVFYRYKIWRNLDLVTNYRYRNVRNLEPGVTSGAYRAQGLSVELAFQFGR